MVDVELKNIRDILPEILESGRLVDNYSAALRNTFQVHNIDVKFIGLEDTYMLSTCYRVTLEFSYDSRKFIHHFVVKKTPTVTQEIFDAILFDALFNNEIIFYTRVLPEIQKFIGGAFQAPKYFYSKLERTFGQIILEDFAISNWTVARSLVNLPFDHLIMALRYLGNFHGLAYAMKRKLGRTFSDLIGGLKESRFANDELNESWEIAHKACIVRAVKSARKYNDDIDEAFLEKFIALKVASTAYNRMRVAPVEPLATLCHGDYLRNNVAYKYVDDVPQDIMMFDYQTLRYSSPMVDLTVFLAMSAFAAVRAPNFDALFATYCQELKLTYERYAKAELPEYLQPESLIKEYVRVLPYSTNISASFLMHLVAPKVRGNDLMEARTKDAIVAEAMTRGGETVDREVAAQFKEMFDLSQRYNVDITGGIDLMKLNS